MCACVVALAVAEILEIVVGTKLFHTSTHTLKMVEGSRLVHEIKAAKAEGKICDFPERNPVLFECVIYFYC